MRKSIKRWQPFEGKDVIVDTDSHHVFLGRFVGVNDQFVMLEDVDAHDRNEAASTNEYYLIEAKKNGIKPNRKRALLLLTRVVSITRLDDVVEY